MYYIIYIYLVIVTCMLNVMEIKYLTNQNQKNKNKKLVEHRVVSGEVLKNMKVNGPEGQGRNQAKAETSGSGRSMYGHKHWL